MPARKAPDWPRMMRRSTAALYCDLTPSEFDKAVATGELPMPATVAGVKLWSKTNLDDNLSSIAGESAGDWRKQQPLYASQKHAS